jgi:GNAT superfamily N-acetyltransferase
VNAEVVDQINDSVALESDGLVIGSSESLIRSVVDRTGIHLRQTQTKMTLEEVPHPADPLRSYLVTRRVDPTLPDVPIRLEIEGEPCARRIAKREATHRVIPVTPAEASNLRFEMDENPTGVIIHAIENQNALRVADVKLWKREDNGYLLDVYVRRHCEEIEPWWGFLAKKTGFWKPLARDWRGCGIGNRLVDLAMNWLREHRAGYAYGQVMKSAVTEQPWLLEWYQRRGFEIREPPPIERSEVHSIIWKTF